MCFCPVMMPACPSGLVPDQEPGNPPVGDTQAQTSDSCGHPALTPFPLIPTSQALANLAQGYSKLCPPVDSHLTAAGQRHPFDPPTSDTNLWTSVSVAVSNNSSSSSSSKTAGEGAAAAAAAMAASADPAAARTLLLFDGIAAEVISRLGNYSVKQLQPRDYCGLLDAFAKGEGSLQTQHRQGFTAAALGQQPARLPSALCSNSPLLAVCPTIQSLSDLCHSFCEPFALIFRFPDRT